MEINQITAVIVDAAMKVHSALGPGLMENAYKHCVAHELRKRGLNVLAEVVLPVVYDGVQINVGYRIDLMVDDCVIVELKAVNKLRRSMRPSCSLTSNSAGKKSAYSSTSTFRTWLTASSTW